MSKGIVFRCGYCDHVLLRISGVKEFYSIKAVRIEFSECPDCGKEFKEGAYVGVRLPEENEDIRQEKILIKYGYMI
jgi:uncharacterized protein with PIN domain